MSDTAVQNKPVRSLPCMEIWGGNNAIDDAISVRGMDAWVVSRPYHGDAGGGDIHYVSTCGRAKTTRFVLADVAGHGQSVDGIALRLRALMRKHMNTLNQEKFVRALNEEFSALSADGLFATSVLCTYYGPTEHLIVCNAGHPPPILYRVRTGTWTFLVPEMPERVDRVSNLPLGVIEPTDYTQFAIKLELDDLVLLYTDAVLEARSKDGIELGQDGLRERLSRLDAAKPEKLPHALLDEVARYCGRAALEDDVTLVLLRHNLSLPPKQSLRQMVKVVGKMLHLVRV